MARIFSFRRAQGAPSFEALVRPHLERLHRLAWRLTGAVTEAEDLVQDLLLKLYPQVDRLAQVDQLGPWLARALVNGYIDRARRRDRSPLDLAESDAESGVLEAMPDESRAPDQATERALTQERLLAALAQLPDEQRALVAWHDIEGYTLEELSLDRNIPLGTLKSRLHRARARLRELLEPF